MKERDGPNKVSNWVVDRHKHLTGESKRVTTTKQQKGEASMEMMKMEIQKVWAVIIDDNTGEIRTHKVVGFKPSDAEEGEVNPLVLMGTRVVPIEWFHVHGYSPDPEINPNDPMWKESIEGHWRSHNRFKQCFQCKHYKPKEHCSETRGCELKVYPSPEILTLTGCKSFTSEATRTALDTIKGHTEALLDRALDDVFGAIAEIEGETGVPMGELGPEEWEAAILQAGFDLGHLPSNVWLAQMHLSDRLGS